MTSSGTDMPNPLAKTKPKRRWLQFSMRAVLLLVTLLCVALAFWVVPAERQRRAVAAIEALGGRLRYVQNEGKSESSAVGFLRRWLPQAYLDEVEVVGLDYTPVTDAGLAHLEGLTGLKSLGLASTRVTDAGLVHLERQIRLQQLSFMDTKVTDKGLAQLEGLTSLQILSLSKTRVTDDGLAHLEGLMALQQLYLYNTHVTDTGRAQLRKALPNCKIYGP